MFKHIIQRITTGPEQTTQDKPPGQQFVDDRSATADTSTGTEEAFSLDDVFGILSIRRRRRILRYLDTQASEVQLGRLAEVIAARENGKEPSEISSTERKRVYVSLYQNHLPKLADVEAITYDSRSGRVTPGPNFEIFLEFLPTEELVFTSPT